MLIESAEVIHYSLPFDRIYSTARGSLTERELVILRLRSEGLEGLGEVAAMTLRGAGSASALAAEMRAVATDQLVGSSLDEENPARNLVPLRNIGARAELLACVDIAVHDLVSQSKGVPLWRLLTDGPPSPVRCNGTLPMANPTEIATLALEWQEDGFDTLKLKVGTPGDTAQVAAVKSAIDGEMKLRLDANGSWTPAQAADRIADLGGESIELVEEPTSGVVALSNLHELTDVRIAADETIATSRDAKEAVRIDACDFAALKLAKVGGIQAALDIAGTIDSYLTSSLEGPVGITAAAHVVQALPDLGLAHGLATERLFETNVGTGGTWNGADLSLPDRPGLGVEIDEEALAARRIG